MRLMKKCAAVAAAMIIAWSAAGSSAHAADKTVGDDEVIVTATGRGWGPEGGNIKDSFYKTYARQAARLDALRNLAGYCNGTEIESTLPIVEGKPAYEEQVIKSHMSSKKLKNAWQVGEAKFIEDEFGGYCEITMATTMKTLKD